VKSNGNVGVLVQPIGGMGVKITVGKVECSGGVEREGPQVGVGEEGVVMSKVGKVKENEVVPVVQSQSVDVAHDSLVRDFHGKEKGNSGCTKRFVIKYRTE